tara:strand:- start:8839 stop:9774 length:936 start_codon:yes stop_codon:yes gene_type:complete
MQTNYICPSCKNEIKTKKNKLFCDNKDCSQSGNIDYLANKKPILIDFENSLFSKISLINSSASSSLKRSVYSGYLLKTLKKILNGKNRTTTNNLTNISERLNKLTNPKILIIGGGSVGVGVEILYEKFHDNIICFDVYDSKFVDFIGDASSIPFNDNSFDFILIQAVLEHVYDPNLVVKEIYRTLKNNGLVYAETPFLQHVHEGAYDFTRFTVLGHRILFKSFEKISTGYIGGIGQSMLWSIEYFFRSIFRSKGIGKIFKLLFFWLRLFEYIVPDSYNIDGACGAFFYGRKNKKNKASLKQFIIEYNGSQK